MESSRLDARLSSFTSRKFSLPSNDYQKEWPVPKLEIRQGKREDLFIAQLPQNDFQNVNCVMKFPI